MAAKKPLVPLYVRIPQAQSNHIERVAVSSGKAKQAVVHELFAVALEQSDGIRISDSDVLTLDRAAELLQVSADDVCTAVEHDGLPGRRIGDQWRFSRVALLHWLGAPAVTDRPVGFSTANAKPSSTAKKPTAR